MASSRSTRVTRSTVGLNGLDESFGGRNLRNCSIAHPEEISSHSQVRSRSPKKRPEPVQIQKGNNNGRTTDIKQQIQDLESLGRRQREALKNPIGFVEKLQKKADIGLPYPQRVVQLPEIVWDQYTNSLGNFEREFKNHKRHTRRVKLVFDKVGLPARPKSPLGPRKDRESLSYSMLPLSDGPEGSNSHPQMIRGRLCDDTKPETFNQLWTVEEQKNLEQLLLKYPPEEVESRHWKKIADELGNRTAKQVAS
ncbi:ZZ-type zinc finger-containing protein 3-like [Mesoplodon densirostris]|uniref:ZZ-type zinc finger-containing protein 3-like n=1 Tax=Mesoplodon densirostris TaxID=48708 RepID=UPI0028DD0A5E|nr:ZZ-type zinc finger-containing protein 3-like [Mesoplodon densirostris]